MGLPEEIVLLQGIKVLGAILLILLGAWALFLGWWWQDQQALARREAQLAVLIPGLPSADPGMVNAARYLRHYGLAFASSAFPDFPGQRDYLPSGMFWPPPEKIQEEAR